MHIKKHRSLTSLSSSLTTTGGVTASFATELSLPSAEEDPYFLGSRIPFICFQKSELPT